MYENLSCEAWPGVDALPVCSMHHSLPKGSFDLGWTACTSDCFLFHSQSYRSRILPIGKLTADVGMRKRKVMVPGPRPKDADGTVQQ